MGDLNVSDQAQPSGEVGYYWTDSEHISNPANPLLHSVHDQNLASILCPTAYNCSHEDGMLDQDDARWHGATAGLSGGGGTVEISNGGTIDNDHYIFFVARIGVRLKVFGRLYANDGLRT